MSRATQAEYARVLRGVRCSDRKSNATADCRCFTHLPCLPFSQAEYAPSTRRSLPRVACKPMYWLEMTSIYRALFVLATQAEYALFNEAFAALDDEARSADPEVLEKQAALAAALQ